MIIELQYFPPITFFSTSYTKSNITIDIYEHYRKMSFRNRCLIAGADGVQSLSVPLQHGRNQRVPMHAVEIAQDENWAERHLRSIRSAYNRSPFYEYYADELEAIYRKQFGKLAEFDLACLYWVKEKLGWKPEVRLSSELLDPSQNSQDDRRNLIVPKNYSDWNPVRYRQVFEDRTGFLPNLSILDLLFNEGRNAGELLRGIAGNV